MNISLQVPFLGNAYKLFLTDTPATGNNPNLHWPFIDIFFFGRAKSNVYELDERMHPRGGTYQMRERRVFPLRDYFFGGIHLPGPWDRSLVSERYRQDKCVAPRGNHRVQMSNRKQLEMWRYHPTQLDCCRLSGLFPFVRCAERIPRQNSPKPEISHTAKPAPCPCAAQDCEQHCQPWADLRSTGSRVSCRPRHRGLV